MLVVNKTCSSLTRSEAEKVVNYASVEISNEVCYIEYSMYLVRCQNVFVLTNISLKCLVRKCSTSTGTLFKGVHATNLISLNRFIDSQTSLKIALHLKTLYSSICFHL